MMGILSEDRGDFISIKQSCQGSPLPILHLVHALSQHHPPLLLMSFFPKRTEKSSSDHLCCCPRTFFCLPWRCGHLQLSAGGQQQMTCPCSWFPPNTKNDSPIPLSWNTDNPTGFLFHLESKWKLVFHPLLRN